ncbi:uncharacterized protein I303_105865 [Kwoniella dejecticola CBS 10117]|uniref:Uncharacterized protein n=1 Tax=Kwoniella dejecticola CBS 10117 TaxID=1296121 RepID=A0A1A6A0N7_9TREE|nr:uncharacterized protein I303_05886 [Kwoniella dejecticola CBS 10117]OBR83606.1 hypothetical protein I303_05886 [Kwoniella dejecticola CBS 10117]
MHERWSLYSGDVQSSFKWQSSWLHAVAGVLARHDKLGNIGDPPLQSGWETGTYKLFDAKCDQVKIDVNASEILSEADTIVDTNPWLEGLETAALKLEPGFMGLDGDKITWGNAVSAFKMLTGKSATYETIKDKDHLFKLLYKARTDNIPMVFGSGSQGKVESHIIGWSWYQITSSSGYETKIWDTQDNAEYQQTLDEMAEYVQKVVYQE